MLRLSLILSAIACILAAFVVCLGGLPYAMTSWPLLLLWFVGCIALVSTGVMCMILAEDCTDDV